MNAASFAVLYALVGTAAAEQSAAAIPLRLLEGAIAAVVAVPVFHLLERWWEGRLRRTD
jgi:hypothetical protein